MKRILCFGDSNTWGVIPRSFPDIQPSERYPEDIRWPQVMLRRLGNDWQLIEEGLGGRTTVYQAPGEAYRPGDMYLTPCLLSHRPLDYLVIMLGTNDLQPKFHNDDISDDRLRQGFERIIEIVLSNPECGAAAAPPKILMLAPPPIKVSVSRPDVSAKYGNESGVLLSKRLPKIISSVSHFYGTDFLDASAFAEASNEDGVHFDRDSHLRLGAAVAKKIKEMEAFAHSSSQLRQSQPLRENIEM